MNERKEVVEIAKECTEILKRQKDIGSVMIAEVGAGNSERYSVKEKVAVVNALCVEHNLSHKDSILLSIHANAGGATGIETYYYDGSEESKSLAQSVGGFLSAETNLRNRGAKPDTSVSFGRIGIIRDTKPLAVLVECGFVDHIHDARLLRDPQADDAFAEGIVRGLMDYLHLKYTPVVPATVPPKTITDIRLDEWYSQAVNSALLSGLMTAYPDGSFRPHQPITRAELAVVMERHLDESH